MNYIPRPNLQLRKMGKHYMIVQTLDGTANLTNVFTLNESAAHLWQCLCSGSKSATQLADHLAAIYGNDSRVVLPDVERQLAEWQSYGLISAE